MSKKIVVTQEELLLINQRLGQEITNAYKNNKLPPVLVGVLKGAIPFMMDLLKYVECDCVLDFVQCSTYNGGTTSSNTLVMKKDTDYDIKNRDVLIVEDIVDSGQTLNMLVDHLKTKGPRSVKTCVLLDKAVARTIPFKPDFCGKQIGKGFIVGYGFDYQEYLRNKQEIYIIDEKELNEIDAIVRRERENG